jgi:hypothetical protein
MNNYTKLADYLQGDPSDKVRLTFADIEHLIGSTLPKSARKHNQWWANSHTADSHVWSHLWLRAGWKKSVVDLSEEWVEFTRIRMPPPIREFVRPPSDIVSPPDKIEPDVHMNTFSEDEHQNALLRRRIKFVAEKGAMARHFCKGTNKELQKELFRRCNPSQLARLNTVSKFDDWLCSVIENDCWSNYSRGGLETDRWAYFAKLINIVIYEIVANRELFQNSDWQQIRHFLHVPIDSTVMDSLSKLDPQFPMVSKLKGMSRKTYFQIQHAIRALAKTHNVSPIWFEAAYSA